MTINAENWPLYQSMCEGKVKHETLTAANGMLEHLKRKQPRDSFRVYQCEFCSHFHVGHTQEKKVMSNTNTNTKLECKACGKPEKKDRRGNSNMVYHLGVCVDCANMDVTDMLAGDTLDNLEALVENVLAANGI